ncbi:Molybdenum cofactor synthesis protein [Phytophthora megakarya]|uniref:Molybdenum cofactor synthesis protein n=1 Tax=Phytophthora megakarya TaxID=4795 RepID=A0A225X4P2_9STRA|nr:Molybdenum cofactor synthesis protein [Phytophthora megakarya]
MATTAPGCTRCTALENELAELRAQNSQLQSQLEMLVGSKEVTKEQNEEIVEKLSETLAYSPFSRVELQRYGRQMLVKEFGSKAQTKEQNEEIVENLSETLAYSPFSRVELQRYGRQMLVKEFGSKAQLKLRAASVLLIGVGGLGSPVAMYLAAMGVGTLAIVDNDHVDRSNLHRQILHDEQGAKERVMKVESAKRKLQELNPLLRCVVYPTRFTATNALKLVAEHDVVVDASDNVGTRYLANDACAQERKPLVSGSALGLEGQVTVFTYQDDENATGCYRCLYPTPPRVAMSCAENGVIGVVPGVIGCIQAMETVKVITGVGEPLEGVQCFYDAYDGQFRRLKLGKKRNPNCQSCGRHTEDSKMLLADAGEGSCADGKKIIDDLGPEFRISAEEFDEVRKAAAKGKEQNAYDGYVLLDTRAPTQFEMVHFPEAVNIPTAEIMKQDPTQVITNLWNATANTTKQLQHATTRTFVICRRGVDSVKVTRWLINNGIQNVFNINGGYTEYAKEGGVDPTFPMY